MLNPRTHTTEHASSYYAASRTDHKTYPVLSEQLETDVCVIGGGFSGVNTALELAERGLRVVLLEAHRIGWGASGRNGGQLIRGVGHDLEPFRRQLGEEGIQAVTALGFESVALVRRRVAQYDIACDLKLGYCDLANKPRHLDELAQEQRWLEQNGYDHETTLLSAAEMYQVVGSDSYVGGLVDRGSGHLHPLNLVCGEARAAVGQGVRIFEQSPVTAIDHGQPCRVTTANGQVHAAQLVICGNAYVRGLDKTLESKVLPAGSYIIATEPLSEDLWQRVLPQDMAVCDQRVALDYYRLSADRRLLFGGLCNYSGRDPRSIEDKLRPHMLAVFPYLADVTIDYQWGGMIGIGANRFPQIGRLRPNVYYAQAYAGHGVNVSHIAARLIADCIEYEASRGQLHLFERVQHITFPGGRHLRSPLLAMGMLYHRLRDVL